jgi:hypothetical protein
MPNDASLTGKGRDILLPKHGNPFKKTDSAESTSAIITADEPSEVSPADLAARFPSAHSDRNVLPTTTNVARDLAPSDVANLFASSGAAASSSATIKSTAAAPTAATPGSEPIHRSQSMGATEDPNTKVFDGSWLQAPSMITATGAEEALPAHDAEDEIPLVGILTPEKPAASPQPAKPPVAATPSSSPSIRRPTTIMPFTPSMTPSTSQPKPVESKPSTASPTPSLAERLTPPPATASAPAKPADTPAKPADAGFKPANPFASAEAKPPSAPTPVSPPAGADASGAVVNFAAGSSPSQPVAASPSASMARLSFSALSDPFSSGSSHLEGSGLVAPPVAEQEAMIKFLITDERVDELWRRIDVAEKRAVGDNNLGSGERREALDNIRGARNLLLGGKQNYEDALRYVVEVESDLTQATRLKSWSLSYGVILLFYNIAWLAALAVLLTYSKQAATMFAGSGVDQTFFITILCGGLGGVSGALRSMWVHIAKDRDFDPQHLMWYLINPILGAVLAIFAYWVAQLGLVTMSGGTGAGATGNGVFVLYVLGWLVGFQQNVAYQLVEQAVKMIFKREDTTKPQSGATAKPPSSTPEVKPTK